MLFEEVSFKASFESRGERAEAESERKRIPDLDSMLVALLQVLKLQQTMQQLYAYRTPTVNSVISFQFGSWKFLRHFKCHFVSQILPNSFKKAPTWQMK